MIKKIVFVSILLGGALLLGYPQSSSNAQQTLVETPLPTGPRHIAAEYVLIDAIGPNVALHRIRTPEGWIVWVGGTQPIYVVDREGSWIK